MGPTTTHLGSDSDSTDPSLPACLLPSLPKYFLSTCYVQTVDSTPGPGDDQLESFPALEGSASIEAALFSDEPHTRITALALWDPKDRPRRVRGDPPGVTQVRLKKRSSGETPWEGKGRPSPPG